MSAPQSPAQRQKNADRMLILVYVLGSGAKRLPVQREVLQAIGEWALGMSDDDFTATWVASARALQGVPT